MATLTFQKILIANRGEIACRVIRTARRMGIASVAVYSDADAGALHVRLADEACRIGPAPARESYLDIAAIIAAAGVSGAAAVHPGYGFLAENADFAAACAEAGLTFIGPPAAAIRAMGDKAAAKALMAAAGVPVVPGYHGADQSEARLAAAAAEVGYPVLIKPSAGGGGKGMRVVTAPAELAAALAAARREAKSAFGDDRVLIERYLTAPRHIEVQIFADRQGNVVHLFERDCSLQRRHQKIVEEAPAPGVPEEMRRAIGDLAVRAARAVGYVGAGTVELIAEGDASYFMEMNTRLQVEHAVTEMITGLDLVAWQIRVAAGEPLPLSQSEIVHRGHAIEARLYAEDPERGFLPSSGRLALFRLPDAAAALRIETGVVTGDTVSVHYDPLLAKLIAWGPDRATALRRLAAGLAETRVAGLETNRDFLLRLLAHPDIEAGAVDTSFVERQGAALTAAAAAGPSAIAAAAVALLLDEAAAAQAAALRSRDPHSPWHRRDGWRLNGTSGRTLRFREGTDEHAVELEPLGEGWRLKLGEAMLALDALAKDGADVAFALDQVRMRATVVRQGDELIVILGDGSWRLAHRDPLVQAARQEAREGGLTAPMPGKIVEVRASPGDKVRRGQVLMVLEAMKMEHAVAAPADGVVAAVHFAAGDVVAEGAELLTLAAA